MKQIQAFKAKNRSCYVLVEQVINSGIIEGAPDRVTIDRLIIIEHHSDERELMCYNSRQKIEEKIQEYGIDNKAIFEILNLEEFKQEFLDILSEQQRFLDNILIRQAQIAV